jgi:hypothetical protein
MWVEADFWGYFYALTKEGNYCCWSAIYVLRITSRGETIMMCCVLFAVLFSVLFCFVLYIFVCSQGMASAEIIFDKGGK